MNNIGLLYHAAYRNGISNLSASGKSEMTGELHMDTTFQNDFNFVKNYTDTSAFICGHGL